MAADVSVTQPSDDEFFEGAEKLLEIWFNANEKVKNCDLRLIPRHELDKVLLVVGASILSCTSNEFIDSYVLSESSMFISKNRFILKTCGITTLLYAVKPIIDLAIKYGGMKNVKDFFYSRRSFLKPEEQIGVHKKFIEEVKFLKQLIPDGTYHVFGERESEQWYLYSMNKVDTEAPPTDVTLEILMSDMCEKTMACFAKRNYKNSDEVISKTGIRWILPNSLCDGYLFDPSGYSLNGLLKNFYYTIHVTPQPHCSYVSFETNVQLKNYNGLISKVLTVFKPGKFIATMCANKEAVCGSAEEALNQIGVPNYVCEDEHQEQLETFSLAYKFYTKIF